MSEEVYGFDIPVPAIDEEFDVALIGTKGKWYDHKVSVKNPVNLMIQMQKKMIKKIKMQIPKQMTQTKMRKTVRQVKVRLWQI